MSRALELPAPAHKAAVLVRPAAFLVLAALIVRGRFANIVEYNLLSYLPLAVLAFLVLAELVTLTRPDRDHARARVLLAVWLMVLVRVAIQATGGPGSDLYPLAYIGGAVMAGTLAPGPSLLVFGLFLGLEAAGMAGAGSLSAWPDLARHGVFLAAIGAAAGTLVRRERRAGHKARETLAQLSLDVSEFQKDDTVHRLSGLSEAGRNQEDLRSVMALDEAFYQALENGRDLLRSETVVLYWRNSADQDFHLRESASSRDDFDPPAGLAREDELAVRAVSERRPLRVSGRKKIAGALPSLVSGSRSSRLLIAPVVEDHWVHGLLIALRGDADFSAAEEKLIMALAHQTRELSRHALLVRRSEAQAARFKSLASLVHRLSRTMDLKEILEATLRTGRVLSEHQAGAVILPDDSGRARVAAIDDGMALEALGQEIETEATLAGWVMAEQKPLVIPDLKDRDKNTAALGAGLDPPGMRSVMVHPLPLRPGVVGAIVFFAEKPEAFSAYLARVTEMLADFAAVSVQNALNYREMERRAVTDGLTGLVNHRTFQERLGDELERAGRLDTRLAVVLCDIDHFKAVNDTHGHPVGDEVLRRVAHTLQCSIRKVDTAARYGGEEFVLVLMGADGKGAFELAERFRKKVERLIFPAAGGEFRVSISLGIALYPDHAAGKDELIELADQALYRAKKHGRNRTVLARVVSSPERTEGKGGGR